MSFINTKYVWHRLNCDFFLHSMFVLDAPVQCTVNEDCSLTEACIQNVCHHPCDVHNPCAEHAVCINVNHGSDCSCAENFHGNGYVGCQPGESIVIL